MEDLIKALQDDDPEVRAKAARTLGRIRIIRLVVRAPEADYRSIRGRAKKRSKAMGDTRAVVPLLQALQDENSKVRSARLIANDNQNEKQINKEMRSLYRKRSKLVHGEKVNITPKDIYLAEEHLRKSIKLFLKYLQTISHDMIISILNTNMHY